jgi:hypothetical protein
VSKYVKEHESSVCIPSSPLYRGKRWSQLEREELEHILQLVKGFLEWLLSNWEVNRSWIINPQSVGRGIRARSEPILAMSDTYSYDIERARQVAFAPYLSTWYAFMSEQSKLQLWQMLADGAEDILGCKVYLPPLLKGGYWYRIYEDITEGNEFVNGDGGNWEAWSATITQLYCYAVDDGVPQYMSGTARTSFDASFANLKLTEVRIPRSNNLHAIGVLGDDEVILGPENVVNEVRDLEHIWEIDQVATKNRIVLGMVILEDGLGTYPGMARITVDRGDKKIPIRLDEWSEEITGSMSTEAFDIYKEIAEYGTLHGEPLLKRLHDAKMDDFWEGYRKDRYEYMGSVMDQIQVLPMDEGYVMEF